MNRALWNKAIRDSRTLLLSLALILFCFHWLFVWMTSKIQVFDLPYILDVYLSGFEPLSDVPFKDLATREGLIALAYVDPLVLFVFTIWGIGRGSDCVSGELGRGTMEMLLAQPVSRFSVLFSQAVVTTAGAMILAIACWLGTFAGIATIELDKPIGPAAYLAAAMNLFAFAFFLAGLTTMVSSWDRYRWRTIGLVGGFYMIELIFKIVSRYVDKLSWLGDLSFFGAFQPQVLVRDYFSQFVYGHIGSSVWKHSFQYDGILIGLGLIGYIVAAVVFCRRDLPAPL